jgi:gluconokinase
MAFVPGIRSPYIKVGRLVYFGRMMDKIRLHAVGKLPSDYQANLGDTKPLMFDARCCRFLGVTFTQLQTQAAQLTDDSAVLSWAHANGIQRTDEECEHWNAFMLKLGWRDSRSHILKTRMIECGVEGKPIETMFDLQDFDEGRDPSLTHAWELQSPSIIVLMGVAGCGKTTTGKALAEALGWKFKDADEFHSANNIQKMGSGVPLNEEDRAPWLKSIRAHIEDNLQSNTPYILTCSALKQSHRDALLANKARVRVVYLKADLELLRSRLKTRQNHFMKESLLDSQFTALEEPQGIITLDASQPVADLVATIRKQYGI